ncbi:MAG: site-specific integrase [Candidatus Korarchaeum sp.]
MKEDLGESSIKCPRCGSLLTWRAGSYEYRGSRVQRYLCRECYYRFSEPRDNFIDNRSLGSMPPKGGIEMEGENTHNALLQKRGDDRLEKLIAKLEPPIKEFVIHLLKNGYSTYTIVIYAQAMKSLQNTCPNLFDPESVKEAIAKRQDWGESWRRTVINAYDLFLKMHKHNWEKPKVRVKEKLPMIPREDELNTLIDLAPRKLKAFLMLLKETGMRYGEALCLRWEDVDEVRRLVRVTPEKGSNPRILPISEKLMATLKSLPREAPLIFGTSYESMRRTYESYRRRVAKQLGNTRLLSIRLHDFRHWKATTEYAKTKDILRVKQILGHKSLLSTMRYTQLVEFNESSGYDVVAVESEEELVTYLSRGYDFIGEIKGKVYLRRRI